MDARRFYDERQYAVDVKITLAVAFCENWQISALVERVKTCAICTIADQQNGEILDVEWARNEECMCAIQHPLVTRFDGNSKQLNKLDNFHVRIDHRCTHLMRWGF